ncbi:hypothetical protein OIU85_015348 [Salix viminalis]|uniref:Coiled-coil domain-containing protein n=1 Tax=Salix viminalis TaxID=40686 RepID=A0A9Q0NKQ3_SALVM|nr:hypothetical protein OIU85_015348 [Salix viminalis]
MVLVSNTNRDDSIIEASTVEEAIAQISVADTLPVDRHPERRLKASFQGASLYWIAFLKIENLNGDFVLGLLNGMLAHAGPAFEEAELPKLKEEKPGLTHTQYKDMIWKLWKKSPDNPLNQSHRLHLPWTPTTLKIIKPWRIRSLIESLVGRVNHSAR